MYYAIRKGAQTGIFESWDICKQHIQGFKRAEYKKFKTKQEALNFLNDEECYIEHSDADLYVYCDGSCIHNGQTYSKTGIGIYFGENDIRNVSKQINGHTNNVAELVAMIEVFGLIQKELQENKKIVIVSDSKYALHCVKDYGKKQEKEQWVNDIPNKELVKQLYETYKNTNVQFTHIYAHTNKKDVHSLGNAKADQLAYKSKL
ncbi:putative ribonuclease H [Organic Lake phycodnavirus 1]|jgi:ribonuclease HI|nr:putative ribonuclease H [Organic Lake phycodnavirus 1]